MLPHHQSAVFKPAQCINGITAANGDNGSNLAEIKKLPFLGRGGGLIADVAVNVVPIHK